MNFTVRGLKRLLSALVAACGLMLDPSAHAAVQLPGMQPDGTALLPNMWTLRPAGRQVVLGDFPVNMAIHPSGKYVVALHSGYGKNEIRVFRLPGCEPLGEIEISESFYGLAFDRSGSRLFASGAGDEVVYVFDFKEGVVTRKIQLPMRPVKERGIPAGLAVSGNGETVFVAGLFDQTLHRLEVSNSNRVTRLQLGKGGGVKVKDFSAPEKPLSDDEAAIKKREEVAEDPTRADAPFPYGCLFDESRQRIYVSLWAAARVAVIDAKTFKVIDQWKVEDHPNEMLLTRDGKYLYVANANRNTVSVLDTRKGKVIETLETSLYPFFPGGSTPSSLALTPREDFLFVANACNNNLAVFDVKSKGKSRSAGFIPVGWYPTSVRVSLDGKTLLVANGKGETSKPNPKGPQPGKTAPKGTTYQHIGGLMNGTLSVIALPDANQWDEQMAKWTAEAYRCSPWQKGPEPLFDRASSNPIPARPGEAGPIKYVLFVIKENRTYDQVLGDMKEGNGDASLCIFPESVTPNHHQLARDFVLLDNFYVESEVSADGHEWTMGAYATDFVEKIWPLSYNHNKHKKYPYPAEGNFPIAAPSTGYLWDKAKAAGVSYRSYGEFVTNPKTNGVPAKAKVPALEGHFDPQFWGFDMDYPDVKRAERFIAEFKRLEAAGQLPRLQILRLPNDHTAGTTAGKKTPSACVADNDFSLGMIVEAVSRSKVWAQTAIFVVEDDAQNGPDHVDAHRTIAYAISPYTRGRGVDSTMYSTSSMLRTMELMLGMQPMTQFDAAARPMFNAFKTAPDLAPYAGLTPQQDLNEVNKKTAWGGKESKKMDFTREDAADDLALNEIVWRSVKGPDSPMPAPRRAAFVFTHDRGDDDDD